VQFMTGRVAEKSMAIQASNVPTRKAVFDDPEVKQHAPQAPDMLKAVLGATPRPQIADYPRMSAIVQTNLQAALTNQISGDEALKRMADQIRTLLTQ